MDNPQYYQPLSHALHPPLVPASHQPQQQYTSYGSHTQPSTANGTTTHREEEEEEDEEEDVVEEELDNTDHDPQTHANTQSSPHASASAQPAPATSSSSTNKQTSGAQDLQSGADDEAGKRKPGRPRGSRNRKPRAPPSSSTKAPANSQHPGFYQYPPAPSGAVSQNQQFYEFQWRALNLCSEFYNAAEELVKAASPVVIAQCYQMGPATKIDPLAMIADAKRVCDNLLANPSQLVGNPPPPVYAMPTYPQMPPPVATSPASNTASSSGVITNASSFVMSLGNPAMPPPSHAPQPSYYPPQMYSATAARYPTTPYYSYAPQPPASYYAPPAQPQPAPTPVQTSPPPPPPATAATGTISTFNAATGSAAPGGQQGTWSEEETERLRKLAEQSREMGGPQNKGEIEWDWVVQQWGNSRTRHQILLKATSMGLKESTTRGTKRRRETDSGTNENNDHTPAHASHSSSASTTAPVAAHTQPAATSASTSAPSPSTANASPALAPQRPPSSTAPTVIAPARTTTTQSPQTSNMPWPMPTVAANMPSPVLPNASTDRANYYRPRPTQTTSYGAPPATVSTTSYSAPASASTTTSYSAVAPTSTTSRPPSSHGNSTATHQYMYRPNGTGSSGRRDGS